MKSAQRKAGITNAAGLQPVAVAAQPESPGRPFEEVLRQCSSQLSQIWRISKLQRKMSLLRALPWLNRARAVAPKPFTAGPLASAWTWLKRNYVSSAARRMRIAETVSLGEKRFVAILHVDGCEFLIGGGTSGISLLAQMEKPLHSSSPAADASVLHEVSR
jgi:hypothetical protein